jgi:hypothetical protein
MRTKISIGLFLLLIAVGFVLKRSSLETRQVSLSFTGYSEDGRRGLFDLRNHTHQSVAFSHAVIQVSISGRWTNYFDPVEESMLRCGIPTLVGRESAALSAAVPSEPGRWRAAVRCTASTDGGGRVQWLLEVLGLRRAATNSEFTVSTGEILR